MVWTDRQIRDISWSHLLKQRTAFVNLTFNPSLRTHGQIKHAFVDLQVSGQ